MTTPRRASTSSQPGRPLRAFQACTACKEHKVRCEIEDNDSPCRRCRRARLRCVFAPRPIRKERRRQVRSECREAPSPLGLGLGGVVAEAVEGIDGGRPPEHLAQNVNPKASEEYGNLISASKIRNTGEALHQILEPSQDQDETSKTSAGVDTPRAGATSPPQQVDWTLYPPWQQGWITTSECEFLLDQLVPVLCLSTLAPKLTAQCTWPASFDGCTRYFLF